LRFLVDENLSPSIVERLAAAGYYAAHVAHAGLAGKSDPAVFRYALAHDFIVATMNAGDFITLASGCDLHPGVIVLRVQGLTADEQWRHLAPVVAHLAERGGANAMVNHAIEITGIGRFRRYPLPPE
jgi:predicted nuclease of predicted toxin-antitoxin system